jgi:hypothetical protein
LLLALLGQQRLERAGLGVGATPAFGRKSLSVGGNVAGVHYVVEVEQALLAPMRHLGAMPALRSVARAVPVAVPACHGIAPGILRLP